MNAKLYIKRYGLSVVSVIKVDLCNTYFQYRSDPDFVKLFTNSDGIVDISMANSPHYEFAYLYYKKSLRWLKNNFKDTKYYIFKKHILKRGSYIPLRKIHLFDSIRNGYLKGKHKKDYIVLLDKPLIETRYKFNSETLGSPEVFMGHHRLAALLALGVTRAKVIMAKDLEAGSCNIYGKLHDIYTREK